MTVTSGEPAADRPATDRPTGRGLAGATMARIGARVVSSLALGACLLLIARGVAPAEFGALMTAYAVGLVVGLAAGVGAPVRVLRAPAGAGVAPGSLFIVHTAAVLTAGAAAGLVAAVVWPTWAVAAGLVFATSDTLQNYAQAQLTATGRRSVADLLVVTHRVVPLVAVATDFMVTGGVGLPVLLLATTVPAALGVVVPWVLDPPRRPIDLAAVFTGWSGYWGYSGSAMLTQLQIPVLGVVAAAPVVASYALAMRVVGPITLVTASLTAVAVPGLAARLAAPASFSALYRRVLATCGGYAVLVVAFAVPGALALAALAGDGYRDAVPLFAASIVGAALSACSQGFNIKLLAVGSPWRATAAIVSGGLVALALLAVLGGTEPGLLWLVPVSAQIVVLALIGVAAGVR